MSKATMPARAAGLVAPVITWDAHLRYVCPDCGGDEFTRVDSDVWTITSACADCGALHIAETD